MRTVKLFDCEVAALTLSDTVREIEKVLQQRQLPPCYQFSVNASKVVMMERNRRLKYAVQTAGILSADGQSVVWLSRLVGRPLPERVAGIDLMERILSLAAEKNYKVYLLGGTEEVVCATAMRLQEVYPRLCLAGYRNGYFSDDENDAVVRGIRDAQPDILFVGMSSPKKELWLSENFATLGVRFAMGVGGSFDVLAGIRKRAPHWMQQSGLEWLFRLLQEPGRMWRRYLLGNLEFSWYAAREVAYHLGRRKRQ